MNGFISVIIPTYNRATYLEEAIESVLSQTYGKLEIIVVDDGSRDNTRETVAMFGDKVHYHYQENKGESAARNKGLELASSQWVAFLDSDDKWLPHKLERQFAVIADNPDAAIIGCGYILTDINNNYIGEQRADNVYRSHDEFLKKLMIKNVMYGSSSGIIVRKECFDKVGFFDTTLHYRADWDMWLRLAMLYKSAFVEDPLVMIRVHNNRLTGQDPARIKVGQMAALKKHLKAMPWLYRIRALSGIYADIGEEYSIRSLRLNAIRHLLVSFLLYPLPGEDKRLRILGKSFLPSGFIRMMGRVS